MRAVMLLLVAACATSSAGHGVVTFKSSADYAARPVTFSVGGGRVTGADLDMWLADGCVRGTFGRVPIDFCRVDKGDKPAQHWRGGSGEFSVQPDGDQAVSVVGYWTLDPGRTVDMAPFVRIGSGGGWDELRRNPALLVIAATAADLTAARISR